MEKETDSANDLAQFHEVFFDEAAEHLAEMESLLLAVDVAAPQAEDLNAIFRAAHSIKGGAGMFGFEEIVSLTHEMETVFDKVRRSELPLSTALVDTFLASGDMLKSMLDARRSGDGAMGADAAAGLCARLQKLQAGEVPQAGSGVAAGARAEPGRQWLELAFGPFDAKFSPADVDTAVGDLADFGPCSEIETDARGRRRFMMISEVSAEDMRDALGFMIDPDHVEVIAHPGIEGPGDRHPASGASGAGMDLGADGAFGLFGTEPQPAPALAPEQAPTPALVPAPAVDKEPPARAARVTASNSESASIRVSTEKVDQLINLVGELVITQAMLAQSAAEADAGLYEKLQTSLAQLERNTRGLQEAAMSIRMMPMSFAFSRFPRVVRDLAQKLGKEIELRTVGEGTELDKGLIERIVDPLMHLVRNSIDHGIEMPSDREASGKPRAGTITLSAFHQGGNIVIEVSDDGKGLSRERILAKARERGFPVSDDMPDGDVWNLIFEAGFSTAEVVTDVSGRGVGMDVVRRNIKDLGGRIDIHSVAGKGTRMNIRLPLTLAILDGMSVRIGGELYIIPLGFITESLQPKRGEIRTLGGTERVIKVREEYLPVVSMPHVDSTGEEQDEGGILVVMETEGCKTALQVDELVGQHQVVIKSLETNYRRVEGISGATIMGDGRVALILDVGHLVGLARQRLPKAA